MSDVSIRDARLEDLPRIVELLQQMSLDGPREDLGPPLPRAYYAAFEAVRSDPRQRLLVIARDGRVVGTATLVFLTHVSYGGRPHAIVENVVVDGRERGHGLGERLLRHCMSLSRGAGCIRLSLTTDTRRTDAHRFYERLGFVASHKGYRLNLQ